MATDTCPTVPPPPTPPGSKGVMQPSHSEDIAQGAQQLGPISAIETRISRQAAASPRPPHRSTASYLSWRVAPRARGEAPARCRRGGTARHSAATALPGLPGPALAGACLSGPSRRQCRRQGRRSSQSHGPCPLSRRAQPRPRRRRAAPPAAGFAPASAWSGPGRHRPSGAASLAFRAIRRKGGLPRSNGAAGARGSLRPAAITRPRHHKRGPDVLVSAHCGRTPRHALPFIAAPFARVAGLLSSSGPSCAKRRKGTTRTRAERRALDSAERNAAAQLPRPPLLCRHSSGGHRRPSRCCAGGLRRPSCRDPRCCEGGGSL